MPFLEIVRNEYGQCRSVYKRHFTAFLQSASVWKQEVAGVLVDRIWRGKAEVAIADVEE